MTGQKVYLEAVSRRHFRTLPARRFVRTGEVRRPRRGEWYLTESDGREEAHKTAHGLIRTFPILRMLPYERIPEKVRPSMVRPPRLPRWL